MPIPTLPASAAPNNWLSTGTSGATLVGNPAKNNQLAANNYGITLVGAARDDTFIAYSSGTKAVELPGGGIDTVVTWGNGFTLGANVENLTLKGTGNSYAAGNAGDNRLIGNDGANKITSGGGDDVVTGGKGGDTFVFTKQAGSVTWITDLEAADKLDLTGFGLRGFAEVRAAMSQIGADLRVDLGSGQAVMLANRTAAAVAAGQVAVEAAATGLHLTFADEFDALSLRTGTAATAGKTWKTSFFGGERTLAGNHELQLYVDPDYKGVTTQSIGLQPFSVQNGVLKISARPVDALTEAKLGGFDYTSGLLTTQGKFAQTYGHFEIRADTPAGKGLFPAFWLLSADGKWPPEIDVFEQIGSAPTYVSHGVGTSTTTGLVKGTNFAADMTQGFHTYAMDWTAQTITFLVDGKQTYQVATPADLHKPMYVLINLAVGGDWPGAPDATTDWSKADLLVDYVRVYSHDPLASPAPRVVISNAVDPTDLSLSFAAAVTGPSTSKTYTAAQIKLGTDPAATVTVAYDADNALTLSNNGAWNAIKNATVTDASNGKVDVRNFVDVEIALGIGDGTVLVTGAKRGTITTQGGHDTVAVAGISNNSTSNLLTISTGGGDDRVSFSGGVYSRASITASDGADRVVVSGQAAGGVSAGAGDDLLVDRSSGLVTLTGGTGADVYEIWAGARATIADFELGRDRLQLIGVAEAGVNVTASGGSTLVDLGGGASVKLLGVSLTEAQIDPFYG